MKSSMRLDYLRVALTLMVAGTSLHAYAQPNEPIFSDAEYVLLDSIEPRLYLLTRMIMDVSQGKIPPTQ
jgi:hypothetical protein